LALFVGSLLDLKTGGIKVQSITEVIAEDYGVKDK